MKQKTCRLADIEVDKLVENPIQPVGRTIDSQMVSIKQSLREHGLVSPLSVAPAIGRPNFYMVADGTRRWHAFEGPTINCLIYDDDDPLDLFVILNSVRKTIGGAAWFSSWTKASDDATRARLLLLMPRNHRTSIKKLDEMLGREEAIQLGLIICELRLASQPLTQMDVSVRLASPLRKWRNGRRASLRT